jgi:hypothetical protein
MIVCVCVCVCVLQSSFSVNFRKHFLFLIVAGFNSSTLV